MVTIAINLAALPEKIILQPVQAVPLPQNYRFDFSWAAGFSPPRRDAVVLFLGNVNVPGWISTQTEPGPHGFNTLLQSILYHAHSHDLWGQTVQCTAVSMAANGTTFATRSNAQALKLPVKPLQDIGATQWPWNVITGDMPAPLSLPFQSGRRLYRRAALGGGTLTLPKLWYVKADNTLEDTPAARGFDRMTFWQAIFGMSLKQTTNLKFEDVMAKLLNAHVVSGVPAWAKLADLLTALGSLGAVGQCLLWNANRFVCVRMNGPNTLSAMEFDAQGFHIEGLQSWLGKQDHGVVWNYRRMNHPLPPPCMGLTSLP